MAGLRYRGRRIGFATMHGKERAVAKPFARHLGASLVVPSVDTDTFGTFSGEVRRAGSIIETARKKADLAMGRTGLPHGLGSEGSFGPHPYLPMLAADTEVLLFIDRVAGVEFEESIVTPRTNFRHAVWRKGSIDDDFLRAVDFPRHAVVVTPNLPVRGSPPFKGLVSLSAVIDAVNLAATASADGHANIMTDMRAHHNPTRMKIIRLLASRLARRLANDCPSCGAPGFGVIELRRGLPCEWCHAPTQVAKEKAKRCTVCSFASMLQIEQPRFADPGFCEHCNP